MNFNTTTTTNKNNFINFNNNVLKLFKFFIKKRHTDNISYVFDVNSFFNIISLLYRGADGKTKQKLDKNIIKHIINISPKISHKSGIFIKKGFEYKKNYLVNNNNNDNNIILDYIPQNDNEDDELNIRIFNKNEDWFKKFKYIYNKDIYLHIRDQSYFNKNWSEKFNYITGHQNFYIDNDNKLSISMMSSNGVSVHKYFCRKLNCLFLSLPYSNNDYSMLILMPTHVHNKYSLVNLLNRLSANDIEDFYYRNGKLTLCSELKLPKFEIESEWYLDNLNIFSKYNEEEEEEEEEEESFSYLDIIFDPRANFTNISPNLLNTKSIALSSISKIKINESGTYSDKQIPIINDNIVINIEEEEKEKAKTEIDYETTSIDKKFILMVIDKNTSINKIGLFYG